MGKQKMVLKITMEDSKKRSKALQIAAGFPGFISTEVQADQLVVVGNGVDSVILTGKLRKKMGYVELASVSAVEEKKEEKKEEENVQESKYMQPYVRPYQVTIAPQQYIYETRDPNNDSCCIM